MTDWTDIELNLIEAADEIKIAALRPDGTARKPVIIWVVRVDQSVYVRSACGASAAWYRASTVRHEGQLDVANLRMDVSFEAADPAVGDQIDEAYRTKYRRHGVRYVKSVTTATARPTTLKVTPRRATT
jgi:hypothetical protein